LLENLGTHVKTCLICTGTSVKLDWNCGSWGARRAPQPPRATRAASQSPYGKSPQNHFFPQFFLGWAAPSNFGPFEKNELSRLNPNYGKKNELSRLNLSNEPFVKRPVIIWVSNESFEGLNEPKKIRAKWALRNEPLKMSPSMRPNKWDLWKETCDMHSEFGFVFQWPCWVFISQVSFQRSHLLGRI
jgi:hypothetical protein